MIKLVFDKKIDCENLLGTFLDESHYDKVISQDCDAYGTTTSIIDYKEKEDDCLFKFRKGFFTEEEQRGAFEGLFDAAKISDNRGMATGPRSIEDSNKLVTEEQHEILEYIHESIYSASIIENDSGIDRIRKKYSGKISHPPRAHRWLIHKIPESFDFDTWVEETVSLCREDKEREYIKIMEYISNTSYANNVYSGIAGWYDRFPRFPYGRATAYTAENYEKFVKSYPFLQKLANGFSNLLPERYATQKEYCDKLDEGFYIPETPFTTITVNKTFRTAAHRDAGDLHEGFSNLSVISCGTGYTGGYLVLPEYRVAIDIRPGDLLLINNHAAIHGNTEIVLNPGGDRISLVCYFREGMKYLGSKKYEDTRKEFIEKRRKDPKHSLQRKGWNGVSPNCFSDHSDPKQDWKEAEEWYHFLKTKKDGDEFLSKYHPWLKDYHENNVLHMLF